MELLDIYDKNEYLLRVNIGIKDMKLDPEEVAQAKWLSLKDFEKLFYSAEFVAHKKEYKDTVLAFIKKEVRVR